jgi:hypothetical protein
MKCPITIAFAGYPNLPLHNLSQVKAIYSRQQVVHPDRVLGQLASCSEDEPRFVLAYWRTPDGHSSMGSPGSSNRVWAPTRSNDQRIALSLNSGPFSGVMVSGARDRQGRQPIRTWREVMRRMATVPAHSVVNSSSIHNIRDGLPSDVLDCVLSDLPVDGSPALMRS